jgi:ubiquinone/menaquinone biosynthesis C-methylase UbiE
MSPAAMDKVDITDMALYEDGRFDMVFCSHVLEHVIDDGQALRELRRVLAPGGAAVLLVPLPLDPMATDEVKAGEPMPDAAERVRRFGQDDHVRQYDRADFMARIEREGFRLQVVTQADFPDDDFATFGLAPRSRLYVAHRD